MPLYDFVCTKCGEKCIIKCGMNDDDIRNNSKCPSCKSKLKRDWSASIPHAIVKGSISDIKLLPNQTVVDVDGQPVRLNFIDHGDRSGLPEGSVAASHPGARIDEKTGKAVVDVVSNVPDPLGKIERSKQKGIVKQAKKHIGQQFKTRK